MAPQPKPKKKENKGVPRFSSIKKSLKRSTWDEKMELKNQKKATKEREDRVKAERKRILEVIGDRSDQGAELGKAWL